MKWMLLLMLLIPFTGAQDCTDPQLLLPSYSEIHQSNTFAYDINTTAGDNVTYSLAPINTSLSWSISQKGMLSAEAQDYGLQSLYVLATTPQGCFDMEKLEVFVHKKPELVHSIPEDSTLHINESQHIYFSANATNGGPLDYEWYRDERLVSSRQWYRFSTNYSDAGAHTVTLIVFNDEGLNVSREWSVRVGNRNRGPYPVAGIPDVIVPADVDTDLFNMYNYVLDPDRDKLEFQVFFVTEDEPDELMNSSKLYDITIDELGNVHLYAKAEIYAKQFVRIRATDPYDLSMITPPFSVRLVTDDDAELLLRQSAGESCEVQIECNDWSACLPTNIRVRECFDVNNCDGENTTIVESEACDYNATCFDNLLNQGEDRVDCGGPCDPCPTCFDGIQNQGEDRVDCGGPCDPCPTCTDGLQNQNETDVDCGGPCSGCSAGNACKVHSDCESQLCIGSLCKAPTCEDGRKNQGEDRVDCGGPCDPCPTCSDGIVNQGEQDVDCGGPCQACLTCDDGLRNQGEWFADCGGPCEPCGFVVYIVRLKTYILVAIPVIVIFTIIVLLRNLMATDELEVLARFSRMMNFLPHTLPANAHNIIIDATNGLHDVKEELYTLEDKKKMLEDLHVVLKDFYTDMFDIENYNRHAVHREARNRIKNPFLARLCTEMYDMTNDIRESNPLFKIEMNEKIDTMIIMLNTIRDMV